MTKPDGGPAFPSDPAFYGDKAGPGMSLRDYFAAAALQGWLAGPCDGHTMDEYADEPEAFAEHQAEVARACYAYADAMLAERDKA
jgi:hypothetical protein